MWRYLIGLLTGVGLMLGIASANPGSPTKHADPPHPGPGPIVEVEPRTCDDRDRL